MDVIHETPLEEFTRGELLKMVTEGWVSRVTVAIVRTIARSFHEDQLLRPVRTKDEVRRRFRFCVEGFVIMRRDLKWAVPRILEELPVYLRSRLDSIPWDPSTRKAWTEPVTAADPSLTIDVEGEEPG